MSKIFENMPVDVKRNTVEHFTLPALFEAQVARNPSAVALVDGSQRLTYLEVEEQANRWAHELIAMGIGPEDVVAVALPRSAAMVIALLGVLKAGAAYLPLDPDYPAERLAYLLEDAHPDALIALEALALEVPPTLPRLSPETPDMQARLAAQSTQAPDDAERCTALNPENPAYVIYTSGSTGRPKGVVVTHANVSRLFQVAGRVVVTGPDDVWTLFHSYAFDFSVWEIWGSLTSGGRLVVVPYLVSRSPVEFLALLQAEAVTVLSQTPTAFYTLAQAEHECAEPVPLALRYVIFGGEVLELSRLAEWAARQPVVRLINMYGITETTVHVTHLTLNMASLAKSSGYPIGRPLEDLTVHVLDSALRPLPPGIPGELYVGGPGLTRGYLGQPGLSATRFVAAPFGLSGERIYRSGDRGRYRTDGSLEYQGRTDSQIKLRGFRIEPGEIEAVLLSHADVAQAAVILRQDTPAPPRLVAYLVAHAKATLEPQRLREHAAAYLPEYMLPAAFVVLPVMPLTVNGKLDHQRLPPPQGDEAQVSDDYVAPCSQEEQILCEIWQNVLGVKRVGVTDNFFNLGGDSILALTVIAKVTAAFTCRIPISTLYIHPTIYTFATQLRRKLQRPSAPVTIYHTGQSRAPTLFLVPPGSGDSNCYRHLAAELPRYITVIGLERTEVPGTIPTMSSNMEVIAANYISAIKMVQPNGPYVLVGWSLGGVVAFEIARQLYSKDKSPPLLLALDSEFFTSDTTPSWITDLATKLHQTAPEYHDELFEQWARHEDVSAYLANQIGNPTAAQTLQLARSHLSYLVAASQYIPLRADIFIRYIASIDQRTAFVSKRVSDFAALTNKFSLSEISASHNALLTTRFAARVAYDVTDAVAGYWSQTRDISASTHD